MLIAVPPLAVSWSPPRPVLSGPQYVLGGPEAALNTRGDGVLVWSTTPTKPVFSAGGGVGLGSGPPRPNQIPGGSVIAAVGGVRRGFVRRITVARYRYDGPFAVYAVAMSSGVVFAVWARSSSAALMIARIGPRGVSRARRLLASRADLYEITSGENGPNRVVWSITHVNHSETLYSAPLRASGRLGRARRLVSVGPSAVMPSVAFNDRGGVVVAWANGVNGVNQYVSQPIDVVICPPIGECGPIRKVRLGPRAPYADGFVTDALTDDGTAVVADDTHEPPFSEAAGVWASVSRDGRRFRPEQQISAIGNGPAVTAVGQDQVVLTYTPGEVTPAAGWEAPAVEGLVAGGYRFRALGRYPGTATGDVPALLGQDGSSAFVTYWQTFTHNHDVTRIAIGGPGGIGTVHTLDTFSLPSVAFDGRGDALASWSRNRTVTRAIGLTRKW